MSKKNESEKVEITEIQLFPSVNWCISSLNCTYIKIKLYQKYKRAKFNRYSILGSNGVIQLSVPLKGGRNQKLALTEIGIANEEGWQKRHWRTLFSCYNKSPYFEFYKESLQQLLFKNHQNLFALNLASTYWILDRLKIKYEVQLMDDPNLIQTSTNGQIGSYHYPQVFEDRVGFQSGLSTLDLLFNLGPSSGDWLLKQIDNRIR